MLQRACVLQAEAGELDITEEDLSPAERAAFHRALAAGSLSRLVPPWEPWWRSAEAARMGLSAAGTRIVLDTDREGVLRAKWAPL